MFPKRVRAKKVSVPYRVSYKKSVYLRKPLQVFSLQTVTVILGQMLRTSMLLP